MAAFFIKEFYSPTLSIAKILKSRADSEAAMTESAGGQALRTSHKTLSVVEILS